MALEQFTPTVRAWFASAFEGPTEVQTQAWPAIATGEHVLITAPTGSGKTLAASSGPRPPEQHAPPRGHWRKEHGRPRARYQSGISDDVFDGHPR